MLARAPIAGAMIALVIVFAAAIAIGAERVSVARAIADAASRDRVIMIDVRLPRALLAAVAGAGLALAGAAFQAMLKNPLAEPFVLGVSGGAAFGATTAIALGIGASTALGAALVPVAAFMGGLGATALVYGVARGGRGGTASTNILLAGVMVNAIAAALITFTKTMVSPVRAQQLLRWLTGFVDLPSPASLVAVSAYVAIGAAALLADAGRLNLIALGDEAAGSLGLDVRAMERRVFFACSAIVGAIVSVTGLIGFVGLVVPHALRRIVGPDHRLLLPLSLIWGASVLVACDTIARVCFRAFGTEPPVGAVTAIVGGPIFLWILRRSAA